jgi:hypothetical protein
MILCGYYFPAPQSTDKTTWETDTYRERNIQDAKDKSAIRHQVQYCEMLEIPGQICKL